MKSFANTTIFVTGGTGFAGSHLVEELLNEGARVITSYQTLNPQSYFITSGLQNKTIMVPMDIIDFKKVHDVITKLNVDYIFHLAAQPLVEVAYYNPLRTLESNIMGTANILESARLFSHVKGVIVASSDKAYGKLTKEQYVETDPLQGDHPYDVSKSATDLLVNTYYKTYGLPVVTTRFGNIYGEGDLNLSRIIPGIMKSILLSQELPIRSDGTFVRDYLYVKDVVRGYLMLAKNIEKVKGEAFNFGSDDTLSVIDLLETIEKTLDLKIPYTILNQAKNEIPYQSLNYTKIKKTLGWKPNHTVKSTAKQIKAWYKKHIFYA